MRLQSNVIDKLVGVYVSRISLLSTGAGQDERDFNTHPTGQMKMRWINLEGGRRETFVFKI